MEEYCCVCDVFPDEDSVKLVPETRCALPCQHGLCVDCAWTILRDKLTVKCPQCDLPFERPSSLVLTGMTNLQNAALVVFIVLQANGGAGWMIITAVLSVIWCAAIGEGFVAVCVVLARSFWSDYAAARLLALPTVTQVVLVGLRAQFPDWTTHWTIDHTVSFTCKSAAVAGTMYMISRALYSYCHGVQKRHIAILLHNLPRITRHDLSVAAKKVTT